MEYLWLKGVEPPRFPKLEGDCKTDILVIGGGMAGILCALRLQEAGADYLLVEAETVGGGITKGTTAVLSAQHSTLYQDIIKKFGREQAKKYLDINLRSVERFRRLSEKIPCDFEEAPSVLYDRGGDTQMQREVDAVRSLGFDAEFTTKVPLPFKIAGAEVFPGMAQFHPMKFLYGAAEKLNIREHTFVQKLDGTTAITDQGVIRAKKVIVATHFPFINSHGMYFVKLYQKRSFVIALENAPKINCTMEENVDGGVYLRNYGKLLIVGGGDHRTGKKGGGFATALKFAKQYYPQSKIRYAWANQDCISLDGVPYIGSYSPNLPDVYTATGFNEWGMTTSMAAAEILSDTVLGRENEYASVFKPDRSMLTAQLFSNLGNTLLDFVTPTAKRCPHLGCALKWNPAERSWDCPCHGSRFDENGQLIDSPAMHDANVGK